MPNRSADALFQLIHSLRKSEKRNFKLYARRNSAASDLKIVQLFDALDKQSAYDEEALLKKHPTLKRQQLPNLKSHLFKQILGSLRLLEANTNIELQIREQMDYARILYNKGMYHQSLKALEKLREMAEEYHQTGQLTEIMAMERQIEMLHITRSLKDRAEELVADINVTNEHWMKESRLGNLALQLYGWYINNGLARNEADEVEINAFFKSRLTEDLLYPETFYEKLNYFQSYCWYAFIRQDYLMYYRYTSKWVSLFRDNQEMIQIETGNYLKAMHNLLNAHFNLRNFEGFSQAIAWFEEFSKSGIIEENENNRIQAFVYLYIAKINRHFLEGTFDDGLKLVDEIVPRLDEYELYLDQHRTLIFYYKIASLYFGVGDFGKSIDYLNDIINRKVTLRTDLQCYSRLLHLIAHYELGNFQLLEYLTKSVYRFMAKMQNLSRVEEAIFSFLRSTFYMSARELQPEFARLLNTIRKFEANKFEMRAFAYLDIISWLESKVDEKPIVEVIREKYLARKRFEVKE